MARGLVATLMIGCCAWFAASAGGYPEFQQWIAGQTPRHVDCAMCHSHPEGPDGIKPGQIGSLTREQLTTLNQARQAFEPGQKIDSPILNVFGDRIVEQLGRTGFIHLRQQPGDFPTAYGMTQDVDGDGIPDAQEYLDGTLPVNPHHGNPWRLFKHNFGQSWPDVLMLLIATLLGLFGINNLLAWFAVILRSSEAAAPPPGRDGPRHD